MFNNLTQYISMDLLEKEEGYLINEGSITTITLIHGEVPVEQLTTRVTEIVAENPWLCARLQLETETGKHQFIVPHKPSITPLLEFVNVDRSAEEFVNEIQSKSYPELFTKIGADCVGKDEPMCKIRVCSGHDDRFVVILSMSHIIADGTTYYKVYNMLNFKKTVIAMPFERKLQFNAAFSNGGNNSVSTSVKQSIFRNLDMDKLRESKSQYNQEYAPLWVSTHDLLTAKLFTRSKATGGTIVANARPHMDWLGESDAGNYTMPLHCKWRDILTPLDVRKSIHTFVSQYNNQTPKNSEILITSWAQNYTNLYLGDGCKFMRHQPIWPIGFNGRNALPYKHFIVVFSPCEEELASVIVSEDLSLFEDDEIFKKSK